MELNKDRFICVINNTRRLFCEKNKIQFSNRQLISELFGYGSGIAYRKCIEVGIDPEAYDCNGVF